MSSRLVTIVGAPASGKTTLAGQLAHLLGAGRIAEDFLSNPFLDEAYLGRGAADLPCQIDFLISRARQLARSIFPAEGIWVADYDFCMDAVYARTRLTGQDWQTYQQVHARIAPLIRPADVLIHLQVPVDALVQRIGLRGRDHERAIGPEFLTSLTRAYDNMDLASLAGAVLTVDAQACDLRRTEQCSPIARKIQQLWKDNT
ncbi:MAG: deoxynucleoside kinase [Phycisphaerae bacterium]